MPLSGLRMFRAALFAGIACVTTVSSAEAQFVTVGGGLITTKRGTDPVAEVHFETL